MLIISFFFLQLNTFAFHMLNYDSCLSKGLSNYEKSENAYNLEAELGRSEEFYNEILANITSPSSESKIFMDQTRKVKLELVLIELGKTPSSRLISTLYNIAHVYGGQNTALTVIFNNAQIEILKPILQEWVNVRFIKMDKQDFDITHYNFMLTSKWFWDLFSSKYVLITQTDTLIIRPLDNDLYQFDLIGAPWNRPECGEDTPSVGNGGYSLRNVESMKNLSKVEKWDISYGYHEDVWACRRIKNIPSVETAKRFGVEGMYYEGIPTGIHKLYANPSVFVKSACYLKQFDMNTNKN